VPFGGMGGRNDAELTVALGESRFSVNECALVKRTTVRRANGRTDLLIFDVNRGSAVEFDHWTRPDLPGPPDPHLRPLVPQTVSYDGIDSTAIQIANTEDNAGVVAISLVKHFVRHPLLNMVLGQAVIQPITFQPRGTTLYPDDTGYAMDIHGQVSVTDGLFLRIGAHTWTVGTAQRDLILTEQAMLYPTFAQTRELHDPALVEDDGQIVRSGQPLEAIQLEGKRPFHDARFGA
jgi:hypothetical protein